MKKSSFLKEKLIPLISSVFQAVVGLYCFLLYFSRVTVTYNLDLNYVIFLILFLNGVLGLAKIVNEDAFTDLRYLIDYAQVVLPQTFLTTLVWEKDGLPYQSTYVHFSLGLVAFLFFAFMEYKRQDLTDLALIVSIPSAIIVGALSESYIVVLASVLMAVAYFVLKRGEECMLNPTPTKTGAFNIAMGVYGALIIAHHEPTSWVPKLELLN